LNGDKEGSGEEAGSEKDSSEEDRKEKISKVMANSWLEKKFSSLFFLFAVFPRYETPFSEKIQVKFTTD